jgi:2-oxoglutarate ferredoxin oxidoreductase subunit gamma
MLEEVLLAGFGGQGVLMMGQLVAQAAMEQGLCASWLPSYGPEMRGGTANCITCFSDDEIGAPLAASYDVVVAMNQPSLEKFETKVKSGGTLLINSSIIPIKSTRTDVDVHYIDANGISERVTSSARSANVVVLGAMHAVRPRLKTDSLIAALKFAFTRKGEKLVEANIQALRAGMNAVEESVAS